MTRISRVNAVVGCSKKIILGILFLFFISNSHSGPSKEVIKSCHQAKSIGPAVKFTELSVIYNFGNKKITSCLEDLDSEIIGVKIKNHSFYQEHCGSQKYFLAGKRKVNLGLSINHSLSFEIAPYGVLNASHWSLISYNNKNYICISSAVGENGWAAAISQYYLIENAFDDNQPLTAYFYFFDKKFIEKVRARDWMNS